MVFGCKTSGDDGGDAKLTSAPGGSNPYQEGFTLMGKPPVDGKMQKGTTAFIDAKGNVYPEDMADEFKATKDNYGLNQEVLPNGYTVFRWPDPSEMPMRDYTRLAQLMTEYAQLAGTCLHRGAQGEGEEAWLNGMRSDQNRRISMAMAYGTVGFCQEVVNQLVNRFVPEGSDYLQYGNCGEGGRVGACLAKRMGFMDQEIRVCVSLNDHFFAMVHEPAPSQNWCILDRWNIIGNFQCGVNLNPTTHIVTLGGHDMLNSEWIQRVDCITLDQYMTNPNALYAVPR
jgi:hypothetical protein